MSKILLNSIYFTRIDSDDMVGSKFIEEVQRIPFKANTIIVLDKGYLLAEANPPLMRRIRWWIGRNLNKLIRINRTND